MKFLRAVSLLCAALALGACSAPRNSFAPACPVPGLVKPLAELTRYRGNSQELSDLIIRARIIDVGGKCKPGGRGTVVVTAQVVVDLTRGPAMQGLTYELPVFVAVTDSAAIRDKTEYALTVEFARNVDRARALSPEVEMELPVTNDRSAASFGIIAGFQLTPDELAAARRTYRR